LAHSVSVNPSARARWLRTPRVSLNESVDVDINPIFYIVALKVNKLPFTAVTGFKTPRGRQYRHTAGDAILRSVGQCVVSLSRAEDLVARYDRDEFALLMANASRQIVWQRADLIRQRARSLEIGRNDHQLGPITLSMGVAIRGLNCEAFESSNQGVACEFNSGPQGSC
jgi:Diguanylate cyclase, GGDEF domain